jgi:mannonate dehydratase
MENQSIDYIRTSVMGVGGLTLLRRIADLATLYQIRTGCHGETDLSPVMLEAALHFDTSVPFRTVMGLQMAICMPGKTPAIVSTSTRVLVQFPYQRAYLPVARLTDGTMCVGSQVHGDAKPERLCS